MHADAFGMNIHKARSFYQLCIMKIETQIISSQLHKRQEKFAPDHFGWLPLALHVMCYTPAETTFFAAQSNHQIHCTSMELAWRNWWSHICYGLYKEPQTQLTSLLLCILSSFDSRLDVTTLTHSYSLPLSFSHLLAPYISSMLFASRIPCPPPHLDLYAYMAVLWASVNKAWSAGCHSDCRSF